MDSIEKVTIFCKRKCDIDFSGGNLSSDTGIVAFSEFMKRLGIFDCLEKLFDENISPLVSHTPSSIIAQKILQIVAGYNADDHADYLAKDTAFHNALDKNILASQPTLSRFFNSANSVTEANIELVLEFLRQQAYTINPRSKVVFDIDSTILPTHGTQEGGEWIHHYKEVGYHPLVCYDGETGDLLNVELRNGSKYCGKDAALFLKPLLDEFKTKYPKTSVTVRGDSGFAMPDIYEMVEGYGGFRYVIRLKDNSVLGNKVEKVISNIIDLHNRHPEETHVIYGEFTYQATKWSKERRVVYKLEHKPGEMFPQEMFIVTNTDLSPEEAVSFYCKRGNMENFIKECKNSFAFECMRSHSMEVNNIRLLVSAVAYAVFNLFRRLTLPKTWQKFRADEVRLRLIKIASRIVRHSGRNRLKFCSHYPYKEEFISIHNSITALGNALIVA